MVADKIKTIIAENLEVKLEDINDESKIQDDLGADSLDCVELIMSIEEEFDIDIPDEDADKLLTVGQIVEYVESKTKKEG